jgi:hypothetical protein
MNPPAIIPMPPSGALLVRLTPRQRADLLELLKRCPLKGAEVPAFTELLSILQSAKSEPPKPETPAP